MNVPPALRPASVWLVNLYFGPGLAPTGLLLESLACTLADRGCDVTVMTGRSQYQGASGGERRSAFQGRVRRLWSGPAHPKRTWSKLLTWLCFACQVLVQAWCRPLPDMVVVMTTPPFLLTVFALRNGVARRPCRLVLWNQDTYPDLLVPLAGWSPRGWWYRGLQAVARWSLRRATVVLALDGAMADHLRREGAAYVRVCPNWEIAPGPRGTLSEPLQAQLAELRREGRWLVLYAGNLGRGHDLTALWQYLRTQPPPRPVSVLFVGGGERWPDVVREVAWHRGRGLAALPYVSRDEFEALLEHIDLGLVALDRDCLGLISPSKLHSYLRCGKPVLYLGPAGSNVDEALQEFTCGSRVDQDAAGDLAQLWERLIREPQIYATWQAGARQAHATRYSAATGPARIADVILSGGGSSAPVGST